MWANHLEWQDKEVFRTWDKFDFPLYFCTKLFKVCKASEIKDNSLNKFFVNANEVLIGKCNGKLFACNNSCPHKGASLHRGYYEKGNLVCYLHDYEFDITSGKLVKVGERWKNQAPAWKKSDDLTMYDIFEKSGYVYVELDEEV